MTLLNPLLPVPQDPGAENLPAPTGGLTGGDLQRLRRSLDYSVSDNTRTAYAYAWRSFEGWCQARGVFALPASPPLVAAYLSHLAEERHLSVATVRLHKAALAAVHHPVLPGRRGLAAGLFATWQSIPRPGFSPPRPFLQGLFAIPSRNG